MNEIIKTIDDLLDANGAFSEDEYLPNLGPNTITKKMWTLKLPDGNKIRVVAAVYGEGATVEGALISISYKKKKLEYRHPDFLDFSVGEIISGIDKLCGDDLTKARIFKIKK